MQIRRKILVPQLVSYGVHRQPESADKLFALKFNISHKLQLLNVNIILLSDLLQCTNMNNDFNDFRK